MSIDRRAAGGTRPRCSGGRGRTPHGCGVLAGESLPARALSVAAPGEPVAAPVVRVQQVRVSRLQRPGGLLAGPDQRELDGPWQGEREAIAPVTELPVVVPQLPEQPLLDVCVEITARWRPLPEHPRHRPDCPTPSGRCRGYHRAHRHRGQLRRRLPRSGVRNTVNGDPPVLWRSRTRGHLPASTHTGTNPLLTCATACGSAHVVSSVSRHSCEQSVTSQSRTQTACPAGDVERRLTPLAPLAVCPRAVSGRTRYPMSPYRTVPLTAGDRS